MYSILDGYDPYEHEITYRPDYRDGAYRRQEQDRYPYEKPLYSHDKSFNSLWEDITRETKIRAEWVDETPKVPFKNLGVLITELRSLGIKVEIRREEA